MIWITVEVLWVPFGLVHGLFYAWGVALLILTLLPAVRRYYTFNER